MTVDRSRYSSLVQRVVVGIIFAPIVFLVFMKGGVALFLFLTAITLVGQWELYGMLRGQLKPLHRIIGHISGMLVLSDVFFFDAANQGGIVVCSLLLYFIVEIVAGRTDKLSNVSLSLLITVYPALLTGYLLRIESAAGGVFGEFGGWILVLMLLLIWMFDTASYFAGLMFGKHPFFPSVSPKKTIEGFIGGIAGVTVIGLVIGSVAAGGMYRLQFMGLAFVTALAGQAGDLSESIIKRETGIKDSSNLIPGHGGILDRFDSLIFSGPVVYSYLVLCSIHWGGLW